MRKHGFDVVTLKTWKFENQSEATAFALKFSEDNNIASSPAWANLIAENAIDGMPLGYKFSEEAKQKMRKSKRPMPPGGRMTGKKHSEETKRKMSATGKGRPKTEEWKAIKAQMKVTCLGCRKTFHSCSFVMHYNHKHL